MKAALRTTAGMAVLAIVSSGCATAPGAHARWHTGWEKPGMTGQSFEQDVRECDRQAMQMGATQPGHQLAAAPGPRASGPGPMAPLRQAEHEKGYADCMKGRGYTPAS